MPKANKLLKIAMTLNPLLLRALRYGVAASIEHMCILRHIECSTVVDIGANRGQFALLLRHYFSNARIISFEPLAEPAAKFRKVFANDKAVVLHEVAIGPNEATVMMHVSGRDDSSSLLSITAAQSEIFPGTEEVATREIRVAPLDAFVTADEIRAPAMLKLDVQGFEYEALIGSEALLLYFDLVYCECSFIELYSGQKLVSEIIAWLSARGFVLIGVYNSSYDRLGIAIQADFLFARNDN